MRAVILAAGRGLRLEQEVPHPKVLLSFGGRSLLARHFELLAHCGVTRVHMAVGFRADEIRDEVFRLGAEHRVTFHYNSEYHLGAIVSLCAVREALCAGEDVLFMDGDVLYDYRMLETLCAPKDGNYFLMDRQTEEGEDPVKLCFRDDDLVDFHKRPELSYDWWGEWVGFARFTAKSARAIYEAASRRVAAGQKEEIYEVAMRDVLLNAQSASFQVLDVTGLPWIEVDFPEDLLRAEKEILPRLHPLTERRLSHG